MRRRWRMWVLLVSCLSMVGRAGEAEGPRLDVGHEVLATNDGWASLGAGTIGGSLAVPEQVYLATNRAEFLAALNDGSPVTTSPRGLMSRQRHAAAKASSANKPRMTQVGHMEAAW